MKKTFTSNSIEISKPKRLTAKQKRFVREYALYLDGSKAARNAGYPVKSSAQVAYENLRKAHIAVEIKRALKEKLKKSNIDRDILIGELLMMAGARHTALFQSYMTWSKLPSNVRQTQRMSAFETRVKDYRNRLERIVRIWKKLSIEQEPTLDATNHCKGIIFSLEEAY